MVNKQSIKIWLVAIFLITVMWGLGNVSLSFASKTLGANAVIYTCALFMGSALSLLLYAGKGDLGRETLKSFDTWAYGFILIFGFLISFGIFMHTTSAEGTLLQRLSIIASAFMSWLFLGRKSSPAKMLGLFIVLFGLCFVVVGIKPEVRGVVYSLMIVFAFLQAGRALVAETHKTHSYAVENRTAKDRIRVVGYIMFIVAAIFFTTAFVFSSIEYFTNSKVSPIIPELREFTNPNSIFAGLIFGAIIIAPIRYLEFYVTNRIKAENYLALSALSPFATLFWEWSTSSFTKLSLKEFSGNDWLAAIIILIGGLIIAFSKAKGQIKNDVNEYVESSNDISDIEDSKDILQKSLTYFDHDFAKLAKYFNITEDAIKAVLDNENIALKKNLLKQAERLYRKDLSAKDNLTGIYNRSGLMQDLEDLVAKGKKFTLLYIDLNKFKPINDKYGHQAGDEALQVIAERLQQFNFVKTAARLGGDEFVVIVEKNINNKDFIDSLHKKIEEFFVIKSINMVASLSASIGYVQSADYENYNAEDLLKIADTMMLEQKESSRTSER